jgi:dnd system-associated protein 4
MRRIQRDSKHEELVKALTSGDQPVFREIWRLLTFSALLGYRLNLRTPIGQSDSGKAIPINYFEGNPAFRGLLYLMGIVETDETKCLHATEEAEETLLSVFEEYANGGLRYLVDEVGENSDPLGRILDLALRFGEPLNVVPQVDLSDLI